MQPGNHTLVPRGHQAVRFGGFDPSPTALNRAMVGAAQGKAGGGFEAGNDSESRDTVSLTCSLAGIPATSDTALIRGGDSFAGATRPASPPATPGNKAVSATTGDHNTTFSATVLGNHGLFESGDWAEPDIEWKDSAFIPSLEGTGIPANTVNVNPTLDITRLDGLQMAFAASNASGLVTDTFDSTAATPVPMPASALLGGIGLIILMRRRR
jgi:hypothetical protein